MSDATEVAATPEPDTPKRKRGRPPSSTKTPEERREANRLRVAEYRARRHSPPPDEPALPADVPEALSATHESPTLDELATEAERLSRAIDEKMSALVADFIALGHVLAIVKPQLVHGRDVSKYRAWLDARNIHEKKAERGRCSRIARASPIRSRTESWRGHGQSRCAGRRAP